MRNKARNNKHDDDDGRRQRPAAGLQPVAGREHHPRQKRQLGFVGFENRDELGDHESQNAGDNRDANEQQHERINHRSDDAAAESFAALGGIGQSGQHARQLAASFADCDDRDGFVAEQIAMLGERLAERFAFGHGGADFADEAGERRARAAALGEDLHRVGGGESGRDEVGELAQKRRQIGRANFAARAGGGFAAFGRAFGGERAHRQRREPHFAQLLAGVLRRIGGQRAALGFAAGKRRVFKNRHCFIVKLYCSLKTPPHSATAAI